MSYAESFKSIENKWQNFWADNSELHQAVNPGDAKCDKEKFYCLVMFPYPSGSGLHIGHAVSYTAPDVVARFKRMKGFNVLYPMGWDAFGLPAEQYAIQTGVHPEQSTNSNIKNFKKQLRSLGYSYDWSREISTCDYSYVKWTQWIFTKLYEAGLAYQKEGLVNWCPELATVLANDEVIDGLSERGGHPVHRKAMRQWYLKITDYADRLLLDLDKINWPAATKEMQKNWIGRSEGAEITFRVKDDATKSFSVFTTRPDTLMGVTFVVLAPEHKLLESIVPQKNKKAVQDYIVEASKKSDLQRTDLNKDKSGVFSGAYVAHPITGQPLPIWVADYVLITYGTGAIMAVPAHDERDQEFAKKHSIDILEVIDGQGNLINSNYQELKLDTLSSEKATEKILAYCEKQSIGTRKVNYRLRDWAFSRQRYWGEPIPVLHGAEGEERILEQKDLPLRLPKVAKYEPTGNGESPLASVDEWIDYQDPENKKKWKRESNTMPGSAGSSWYFFRYMDPHNEKEFCSAQAQEYWKEVDLYVGGAEHSVGHLLYSRFWTKFLFDKGHSKIDEPFKKLLHQGMLLAEDNEKMSKSRGNVVNPDDVIARYGSDSLRLFVLFLGPLEKSKPWNSQGIDGIFRFLSKAWKLFVDQESLKLSSGIVAIDEEKWSEELRICYHKTIKQVTEDIENLRMNTAISAMMILLNEITNFYKKESKIPAKIVESFTLLLSPFAPHISEELWQMLGNNESLTFSKWPTFNPDGIKSASIEIPVQVNGKIREKLIVDASLPEEDIKKLALDCEKVIKWTEGKSIKKVIYVKGRLISVVAV